MLTRSRCWQLSSKWKRGSRPTTWTTRLIKWYVYNNTALRLRRHAHVLIQAECVHVHTSSMLGKGRKWTNGKPGYQSGWRSETRTGATDMTERWKRKVRKKETGWRLLLIKEKVSHCIIDHGSMHFKYFCTLEHTVCVAVSFTHSCSPALISTSVFGQCTTERCHMCIQRAASQFQSYNFNLNICRCPDNCHRKLFWNT